MTQNVFVILLAAGSGIRFGAAVPKCFARVEGQTIVEKSLETIRSLDFITNIFVAVPPSLLESEIADRLRSQGIIVYAGGATRRESVQNAFIHMQAINQDAYCLIHDAARVYASKKLYENIYQGVRQYGAVTAAVGSVDSLKEVSPDGRVIRSLPRSAIYSVQTPQAFRLPLLMEAHRQWFQTNTEEPTDDASMVEYLQPVYVVEGEYANKKITFPDDI